MSAFQIKTDIYHAGDEETLLKPNHSPTLFPFSFNVKEDKSYKLYVRGDTNLFYQWKSEGDFPSLYHSIDDALDSKSANKGQYCLNLSTSEYIQYPIRIYKKIIWQPVVSYLPLLPLTPNFKAGLYVKTKNLKIAKDGYLSMVVRVYERDKNMGKRSPMQPLANEYVFPIAEGTIDWHKLQQEIYINPQSTAFVGVWIEGRKYKGQVWVEEPFLTAENEKNLLPSFAPALPDKQKFVWSAQNLSQKEWTKFHIQLNGKTIYKGNIFQRAIVMPEWDIPIPDGILQKENTLSIKLLSRYNAPLSYAVHQISILEEKGGRVAVVASNEVGTVGKKVHLLLKTKYPKQVVTAHFDDSVFQGERNYIFTTAGLNVISLVCKKPCNHAKISLSYNNQIEDIFIRQIVVKEEDGVITSTGDTEKIAQTNYEFEEYLSWYLSENIGSHISLRPIYHWSGTRVLNKAFWKHFKKLTTQLDIQYSHLIDGRELPGLDCNPTVDMLSGKCFLGRQLHEIDGVCLYWGNFLCPSLFAEQVIDMRIRMYEENPTIVNHVRQSTLGYAYVGDNVYRNRAPFPSHDVKEAAMHYVHRLQEFNQNSSRHTGPTVSFRSFYQAGFHWVGLEAMYGSMEVNMAFLRGASRCYNVKNYGTHLALEWSTTPHDTAEHSRRYRIALYNSYMQGASDINTEEGLWHLGEDYVSHDRFSNCCIQHTQQQKDFFRYISSHARMGTFRSPMAFLHGRYDPWSGFTLALPWGWMDRGLGEAEKSWSLLKRVYPLSLPGSGLYYYDCPTDKPLGYFSGAPKGNVDVLPIESSTNLYQEYPALAFLGYNCAEREDMEKLQQYVQNGGTLLLTRAHLTTTTDYDKIAQKDFEFNSSNPFAFANEKPRFVPSTYQQQEIYVCKNGITPDSILCTTDDGLPLVCVYKIGKGKVILYNTNAYPYHPTIRELYERHLDELLQYCANREEVWVESGNDVQFAVYNQDNGDKHIYFLAIDWYRQPELLRTATLRVRNTNYTISLPFGVMKKCVVQDEIAVVCDQENADVLSIHGNTITVQGIDQANFTIFKNGTTIKKIIHFDTTNIQTITL